VASNGSESAARPLIGITSYVERVRFGVWELDAALVPCEYTDTVARAGGIPVLLPPIGEPYPELLARLDGVLLSGGADVSPARYGHDPAEATEPLRPDRDAYEFALLDAAFAADLPVLAVCRGVQVLNAALGGTLHQHLPDHTGHDRHRPKPGTFGTSQVSITETSRIGALLGQETKVHCHHHQAIAEVAEPLRVVARADDGTVEAVEATDGRFVVGVQWHPEQDSADDRLVAALIAEARERATR
jgi:putative glutamine amidotransferase